MQVEGNEGVMNEDECRSGVFLMEEGGINCRHYFQWVGEKYFGRRGVI
jgi:hypothetical protein